MFKKNIYIHIIIYNYAYVLYRVQQTQAMNISTELALLCSIRLNWQRRNWHLHFYPLTPYPQQKKQEVSIRQAMRVIDLIQTDIEWQRGQSFG